MATFKKLEEIIAWQKARELTREIYAISGRGPFAKDFALRDQIRRASISVMSNIAEGFGRSGNKEFVQFLSFAKGSVSEVICQLYIAIDQKYIEQIEFDRLVELANEVGKMTSSLIDYLNKAKIKGMRFK